MEYKLDAELSGELEPYRSAIEATIKPSVEIQLTDNSQPQLWQSKFGGLPYMPQSFKSQKHLWRIPLLLAQINFTEVPFLERLPEKGILQFYLANDNMYGFAHKNPTNQDKFRVLYFPEVSLNENKIVTDFSF